MLVFSIVCRHGPHIGTANVCGLLGRGQLLSTLPSDGVWGITETHLTREGCRKFQDELKYAETGMRVVHGQYAPPLSNARNSIGGKSTGVSVVTAFPVRALTSEWDAALWDTGRLQACAIHVHGTWIRMGVAYGYAKDPYTRDTMSRTDAILQQMTTRIVMQCNGPRILCGDFNHSKNSLTQFQTWRQHGFVEIQEYAEAKWGRTPQPTCRNRTIVDQLWISPELIPLLESVHTDSTYFPDHSVLYGVFKDPSSFTAVPVWRKPLPLPWDQVGKIDAEHIPPATVNVDAEHTIRDVFDRMERAVDSKLRHSGKPGLLTAQVGRSRTVEPLQKYFPVTPLKKSRPHEVQVTYLGESFQHVQWCRQLRRLQSLCHHVSHLMPTQDLCNQSAHLWQSIRRASGFPKGFAYTWRHRVVRLPDCPDVLPVEVPSPQICHAIFQSFKIEFQQLEKALNKARLHQARKRRLDDPNVKYKDLARPKALPVQTLVRTDKAVVTSVENDGKTITYDPPTLGLGEPLFGPQGLIKADHTPGQLTSSEEIPVELGDTLTQTAPIGDLHQVFKAFHDLWDPMWNRHSDKPLTAWDGTLQQIIAHVPCPTVPFEWQPITLARWNSVLKRRKKTSATGPDGITRDDLMSMPEPLQLELLGVLNQIEARQLVWPKSTMTGLITSLEKHELASTPGDFRPICVLSQVYRTWSSIRACDILKWLDRFAADTQVGNRPAKGVKHLYWRMSQAIECALMHDSSLAGLVTDITKCFNNIPREIIQGIAIHLGLPIQLIGAWHEALGRMQRRFLVNGCCSPPLYSVTGYPEGCAMSVAACALLNHAMHSYVAATAPIAEAHSYVDNWELVSDEHSVVPQAWLCLQNFADLVQLHLDVSKTYAWALTGPNRNALKQTQLTIRHAARDLGGHITYCRKRTMSTIRVRIKSNSVAWTWLARSQSSISQKLQLLSTVLWPRLLYGISSVWISIEHFKKLRAAAMESLGWKKKGASSFLQFALGENLKADPGFHCMQQTFLDFRRYCQPDIAFPTLDMLASQLNVKFTQGPCGALLQRMHELGWTWCGDGLLTDHHGLPLHLLDAPVQYLHQRLHDAWTVMAGGIMSARRTFGGMQHVDLKLSHGFHTQLAPEELGILRTARNGTFYSRDFQIHAGYAPSTACPFCGQPDSIHHRVWECPEFISHRCKLPSDLQNAWMNFPDCFALRGWSLHPPSRIDFQASLHTIADQTGDIRMQPWPDMLHLFTDGSCTFPKCADLRLASWAVCLSRLDTLTCEVVSCGGVPGGLQTSLRAEVTAVISAFKVGLTAAAPFMIWTWTDNQVVHDRLKAWIQPGSQVPSNASKDHDLWTRLWFLLQQALRQQLYQGVVKVRSHEDAQAYPEAVEKWAIDSNETADEAADAALQQLPPRVLQTWQVYSHDLAVTRRQAQVFQRYLVDIGKHSIALEKEVRAQDVEQWDQQVVEPREHPPEHLSLHPLPDLDTMPSKHTMREIVNDLHAWLQCLMSKDDATPRWVTGAHLLAMFQGYTNRLGFAFNQKTNQWTTVEKYCGRDHDFCQCSNWLLAAIRCLARCLGAEYHALQKVPDGTTYKCWTSCILVLVSNKDFRVVERHFESRGVTGISSVRKGFRDFQPCFDLFK